MPKVHVISLKIGNSHGLWQYKISGTHERIMMHGLQLILDKTCRLLGYDDSDRSVIFLFTFSAEPFEDYQICLVKMHEGSDGGCFYKVAQSKIGIFKARGNLPKFVKTNYLHEWPERIYFMIERSTGGGIVN